MDQSHAGLKPGLYAPFRHIQSKLADWLAPASEAFSGGAAYRIRIELPGVAEDAIDLTVDQGVLTVSGEKSETREDKGDTWYFSEREFGSFRRSFRLPGDADADKAEAHVLNGVLEITVPRRAADSGGGKKIEVRKR